MNPQPPNLERSVHYFAPVAGMMSLVGIAGKDYPLEFGNYCSIAGGPYLCNMWAENLKEWARRNPDSGPIEITIVSHGDRKIGYVSDGRLKDWCNSEPCVTGHGWPSVDAMREVCKRLGFDTADRACGCEQGHEQASIYRKYLKGGAPTTTCMRCKREWNPQSK